MDLNDVKDLAHWQIAIVAAGVALGVAALAAGARPMVLVGLGLALFGIGEIRNHPLQTRVVFDDLGRIAGKITGHPRSFSPLGLALDAIGILLFFGGMGWYVLA